MSLGKLKKKVKRKLNLDGSCISNFSRQELEALLKKEIKATTIRKYIWFFKGTVIINKKKRIWLNEKLKPYNSSKRVESYIYKIFKNRNKNDAKLKQVLNKKPNQRWHAWEASVIKRAVDKGLKNIFNSNSKKVFYNVLDAILYLVNYSQTGGNTNLETVNADIYTNVGDFLNFSVMDTGKSYVNDQFLNWADFNRLGYWKMTISMKNKSKSGINLLGLYSNYEPTERKDKLAQLRQKLFDDNKISAPTQYTYRNKSYFSGQIGKEEVEYALQKGYLKIEDVPSPPEIIDLVLSKILTEFQKTVNLQKDDIILWELYDQKNDIFIRPEKIERWKDKETNKDIFLNTIVKRLSSAQQLSLTSQTIKIKYVKFKASGKGNSGCLIMKNEDNFCFIYALYLGWLNINEPKNFKKAKQVFRKFTTSKWHDKALEWGKDLKESCQNGFDIHSNTILLNQLEDTFNVNIRIRSENSMENLKQQSKSKTIKEIQSMEYFPLKFPSVLSDHMKYSNTIDLLLKDDHFVLVENLKSLLSQNDKHIDRKELCRGCENLVSKTNHICHENNDKSFCSLCNKTHKKVGKKIRCDDCFRFFYEGDCFENHKMKTIKKKEELYSICDLIKNCKNCYERKDDNHKCGYVWCSTCLCHYEKYTQHDCFVRQDFPHQIKEPENKFIFYDFETYSLKTEGFLKQTPYYCVVWKPSKNPLDYESDPNDFKTFESQFINDTTMKTNCAVDFLNWLITPEHAGYQVIAHNAGKFDAHLLINVLQDATTNDKIATPYKVDDAPIMKGNKILSWNIKVYTG